MTILTLVLCVAPIHAQRGIPFPSGTSVYLRLPELPLVQEFKQPLVYERYWKEIMACSGLIIPREMQLNVKFIEVAGEGFTFGNSKYMLDGYSDTYSDTIYLTREATETPGIVKHEMLHYLIWQYGIVQGHPMSIFKTKCDLPVAASQAEWGR